MAKNLRLGSHIIRALLLLVAASALAGIFLLPQGEENEAIRRDLGTLLSFNLMASLGVFGMLASRKLLPRIQVLAAAMNRSAGGDLTAKVTAATGDDLDLANHNFNVLLDTLGGIVMRVQGTLDELRHVASDLTAVSGEEVAIAERHSSGVREASGAMQEINRSLQDVAQAVAGLEQFAGGNASAIALMSTSIDEISSHMDTLSATVDNVSASIIQMASTEKEIGSNIANLMTESTLTARLVAELDRSIKEIEQRALEASEISATVRSDAETGQMAVVETIDGIGQIRRSSQRTTEAINSLSRRAGDIGSIIQVIDDIAEQTKLLALNASIIAAQAGEHGKGFAVVANEIKELARRTTISTREIDDIIKGVQEDILYAAEAVTVTEQRVEDGERLSQHAGAALAQIVSGVQQATDKVMTITATTVEQASGSSTMRTSMEKVAEMVMHLGIAAREQEVGSGLIMTAVEQMKQLTWDVREATRHQHLTSQQIVGSTEQILAKIGDITKASAVQTVGSNRAANSMEQISATTSQQLDAIRVMDGSISRISAQVELLQREMARFTVGPPPQDNG